MSTRVDIVATGVANLASVCAGLRRAGAKPVPGADARTIRTASHVLLPGVGAFGPGMAALRALPEVTEALVERIHAGRPTLAICLGMQLLGMSSEESPGEVGLGVHSGRATRFPDSVTVPQFGWNKISTDAQCRYLRAGYAYFANSFRLTEAPEGFGITRADHGGDFVAAFERGDALACQFHPELSGALGRALLYRFVCSDPEAELPAEESSC